MKVGYKLFFRSIFKDKPICTKYGSFFEDFYQVKNIELMDDNWMKCDFERNLVRGVSLDDLDNDLIHCHNKFKEKYPNDCMEVIFASIDNNIFIHLVDISDELLIEKYSFHGGIDSVLKNAVVV